MFKILSVVVGLVAIRLAISYAQAVALEMREKPTSMIPVVGISLTANHATAAVRWPNGTFENLGRVEASKAYVKMMERLSLRSSMHLTRPYGSMEDMWDDIPRALWRNTRKKLGLAGSGDAAMLAKMLKATTNMAEKKLGFRVWVIQSFPPLFALYQEHVADAAEYIGLRALSNDVRYQMHELTAAYAGHGMGLDESDVELVTRGKKPHEYGGRHTVLVEYTETAILLHGEPMVYAHNIANVEYHARSSFELGSSNLASEEQVREFVLEYLRKVYHGYTQYPFVYPKEFTVIMTGSAESVGREEIRAAIAEAVRLFGFQVRILYSDPEYVAARGAAEIAWRTLLEAEKKKKKKEKTEL
ncbi:hypothetical protein BKA58DRAFT_441081 [Alternaria rosae]|uniref:uncharacterized protein n=1 Tax=Alternaria rosae TaxID=1187941 RepID=UPI001E8DB07C|nr:uncharacterized protein BKA58DRAFT_441081 [Alternaria rosae]KAH6868639.1 hypothetical protein BKA58DRAFT_441081 [Alternaria rosae]